MTTLRDPSRGEPEAPMESPFQEEKLVDDPDSPVPQTHYWWILAGAGTGVLWGIAFGQQGTNLFYLGLAIGIVLQALIIAFLPTSRGNRWPVAAAVLIAGTALGSLAGLAMAWLRPEKEPPFLESTGTGAVLGLLVAATDRVITWVLCPGAGRADPSLRPGDDEPAFLEEGPPDRDEEEVSS